MSYNFLIVDDTTFMRKMAADCLRQYGHVVVGEATNGKEAISQYQELQPDVVMMDLTMPEMNGIDAIKEIIKIDPTAVILICSASNQQDMIVDALDTGAKGYLMKPFKPTRLNEIIKKYAEPHLVSKKEEEAKKLRDEEEARRLKEEEEAQRLRDEEEARRLKEEEEDQRLRNEEEARKLKEEEETQNVSCEAVEQNSTEEQAVQANSYESVNQNATNELIDQDVSYESEDQSVANDETESTFYDTELVATSAADLSEENEYKNNVVAEEPVASEESTNEQEVELEENLTVALSEEEDTLEKDELVLESEEVDSEVDEDQAVEYAQSLLAELGTEKEKSEKEPDVVLELEKDEEETQRPVMELASKTVNHKTFKFPIGRNQLNFVTSYMCNWQEEQNEDVNHYSFTCSEEDNKVTIEMNNGDNEKQKVELSLDGFRQLFGWMEDRFEEGRKHKAVGSK
jgi:DNA-binding NarL/FixJ family response regulator